MQLEFISNLDLLGFLIDLNYKLITTFNELFFIKDAISSYYFLQDIHSSTNSSYNSQIILKYFNKSEIKLFKNFKDINSYAPRDYTKIIKYTDFKTKLRQKLSDSIRIRPLSYFSD